MSTLPKATTLEPRPALVAAKPGDPSTPAPSPAVTAALGIVHLDSNLRVVEANDALCEQFGLALAEVTGEHLSRFFHPTAAASLEEHFSQLVDGRCGDFSIRLMLEDGNLTDRGCLVTGIALNTVVHICRTDCAVIALIVPDAVHSPQLTPAAALAEVPARILEGVAAGLSTQQLASRLGLSSHGVEYHVSAMLKKLKAPTRSALVARAYALDILVPHRWPPLVRPQQMTRFPVGRSACATSAPEPVDRARVPAPRPSDSLADARRPAPVLAAGGHHPELERA
ncbi:LuxR C-terminal-related transcriptional regulator [Streptomyces graminilatus]|uniref:LuxR C-terminal-related transcriptional regulator n=1 Tax=Streptomyces graminilatus TaxID=1464070 RepID=UPI0006E45C57|nr:LuxR C-terminal-related transcriptional regulator [Streptomyces graminilatus]